MAARHGGVALRCSNHRLPVEVGSHVGELSRSIFTKRSAGNKCESLCRLLLTKGRRPRNFVDGRGKKIGALSVNKCWVGGSLAVVMACAGAAWAASPETLSFGPGRPVPPGNALFGQHTFDAICFACHSHDLSGGRAPPLTGSAFYKDWQGKRSDALVDFILNRMPQDDPGSLSPPMARDVAAYIVSYANRPAAQKPK